MVLVVLFSWRFCRLVWWITIGGLQGLFWFRDLSHRGLGEAAAALQLPFLLLFQQLAAHQQRRRACAAPIGVQRTISHGVQSARGAVCHSRLLTVTTPLRQQGRDVWQFLEQAWIAHHRGGVMLSAPTGSLDSAGP